MSDICQNKHGGVRESIAAYEAALPTMAESRKQVLDAIRNARNGLTSKEYAELTQRQLNTVSGRFSELARDGWIERANETRNKSAVWRATQ